MSIINKRLNMELYNPSLIRNSFMNKYSDNEELRKEISDFFGAKSIVENAHVDEFLTHPSTNTIFVSEENMSKLCLAASIKFKKDFNYSDSNLKPLNKVYFFPDNECNKFKVDGYDSYMDNFIEHSKTSRATLESIEKKEKNRIEKEELFKDMADMNQDFLSKNITSIDFEFDKKSMTDKVKEFGVSIHNDGKIEYHHFLIKRDDHKYKNLELSFNFGDTYLISREESINVLQKYIKESDFLLFHAFHEDLKILKNLDIVIPENTKVIDTQIFHMNHFSDPEKRELISLTDLSKKMGINGDSYHNSGNDAAYTLQSFLKMNEEYQRNREPEPVNDIKKRHIIKP